MDNLKNGKDTNFDLSKSLGEAKDDTELYSALKRAQSSHASIGADTIIKFLAHKNNAVREQAMEIIIKKITANCQSGKEYESINKKIFEELVKYLEHNDPDIRNLAAETLSAVVDGILDEVGNLVKYSNEDIKIYACQILGCSSKDKSIDYLKTALKDQSANVRNCAIIALEDSSVNFDISFLIELLSYEQEPWIRFSVTEVINKKGPEKFLKMLFPLFGTEPDFIKFNILKIFETYCSKDCLLELVNNSVYFSGESFSNFNKTLINIINSKNFDISECKRTIEHLMDVVKKDSSHWNIYQAIKLLTGVKDKNNETLIKLFKDNLSHEHPLVKTAAIEAITNYTGLEIGLFLEDLFEKNGRQESGDNSS